METVRNFYPAADQETQNPLIQCAYTKQTNWTQPDVFHYYSSLIYSSNSFSIPQFIETKKENRELTFRKWMERKMCESKPFTEKILFRSLLYKYDLKKKPKHFVIEPYVGLDFILFLY